MVWTPMSARENIYTYDALNRAQQQDLIAYLNEQFPLSTYKIQFSRWKTALQNLAKNRTVLCRVRQSYPVSITHDQIKPEPADLDGCAIILTAGGEGERLRLSLEKQGVAAEQLTDFTKATFPLPGLAGNLGALQINCAVLSQLSRTHNLNIPVVITTGPKDSTTARVIPGIMKKYGAFGLCNLRIIAQDERLHLNHEGKIVYTITDGHPRPVTNPDETGGPLMKLKQRDADGAPSTLEWLKTLGSTKIILLQATALYNPAMIITIASAARNCDGLGVGIQRPSFSSQDPYGTYVQIEEEGMKKLIIVEQEVRNETTLELQDTSSGAYLPFNTGFYAFDTGLIERNDLPDYATPPKQITPQLPKSPKIGYAATDLISFAKKPAVLTISAGSYAVIKNAEDLPRISEIGRQLGLDKLCKDYI